MAIIKQYLNPYQGAIEAWVRPNWDGNDNKMHKIFHVDAVDTSCVLALDFDEGSGTVAHDKSIYGNDGTIYGAQWVDNGVVGKALRLDGEDDYVSVPAGLVNYFHGDITILCWYKNLYTPPGVIRTLYNFDGNNNSRYRLCLEASGVFNFTYSGSDNALKTIGTAQYLDTASSYFAVTKCDGSSIYLYIEGSVIGTTSISSEYAATTFNNHYFGLGYSAQFWEGIIDEPHIYNRAPSAGEIKSIYENARPGYGLSKGKDNCIGFTIPGSGISYDISSWKAGDLHHIIANYDTSGVTLYVDGAKIGTNARDEKAVVAKVFNDLWVGNIKGQYQFDGALKLRTYAVPIPETKADALAKGLPAYQNIADLYNSGDGSVDFANDTVLFETAGYEFV